MRTGIRGNELRLQTGTQRYQAIKKSLEYANEGYTWTVDMDLEKFFDTVNQDKLVEVLSRKIKDGRVI